jgi:hypothetical protein
MWKNGYTSVTNAKREVTFPHQLQRKTLNKSVPIILDIWWVTINDATSHLHIGHSSAYRIIQDRLVFHKSLCKMVSRITHRTAYAQLFDNLPRPSEPLLQWKWCSFEAHCHWGWDIGSTITLQKANTRVWNVHIRHCQSKRHSKLNHGQEKWYLQFWDAQGPIL